MKEKKEATQKEIQRIKERQESFKEARSPQTAFNILVYPFENSIP